MRKNPGLLPLALVAGTTTWVFSHGLLAGALTVFALYTITCFAAPKNR